jgi:ketosteroid isomerase-like protein
MSDATIDTDRAAPRDPARHAAPHATPHVGRTTEHDATARDRILIHELLGRYYHAVDTKHAEGWLALWADDGLLSNAPHEARGREQLAVFARDHVADPGKHTRHLVTNVFCDVDGDRAAATSYMLVVDSEVQDAQRATAICHSDLVRDGNGWKLRRHVFQTDPSFDFARLAGVAPGPSAAGPPPSGGRTVVVDGEYVLANDGEALAPDVTVAAVLGRDLDNTAGLVALEGRTYLKRDLATGAFEASTDPRMLGIAGQPAGYFILRGEGEDLVLGVEQARGSVHPDHSVDNLGTIEVVGGHGAYRGATGVIAFVERGRFAAGGAYEGTIRASGRLVLP